MREGWVVVQPSPKEGWGLTVIEAGACGTAVVAADSPGLRDSVRRDETGLLVPFGDDAALDPSARPRARGRARCASGLAAAGRALVATASSGPTCARRSLDVLAGDRPRRLSGAWSRPTPSREAPVQEPCCVARRQDRVQPGGAACSCRGASRSTSSPVRCATRTCGTLLAAAGLLFASNVLGSYQWERLLAAVGHPHPVLARCSRLLPRRIVLQQFPARQHRRRHRARIVASPRAETRAAAVSAVVHGPPDRHGGARRARAWSRTLPAIDRFHLGVAYAGAGGVLRRAASAGCCGSSSTRRCCRLLERCLGRIGLGGMQPAARASWPLASPRSARRGGCSPACSRVATVDPGHAHLRPRAGGALHSACTLPCPTSFFSCRCWR